MSQLLHSVNFLTILNARPTVSISRSGGQTKLADFINLIGIQLTVFVTKLCLFDTRKNQIGNVQRVCPLNPRAL